MRTFFAFIAGGILAAQMVFCAQAAGPLNRAVAVVNGEMITSYDLSTAIAPELARTKLDPKKPADRAAMQQLERQVLESMINDIVIVQEAERLKVTVPASEVDTEMQRFRENSRMDEATFQKELARQGLTVDSFKNTIRKNILKSRLLSTMVGRKVVVTKEEIARYYAENKGAIPTASTSGGETVRLAIIIYPPTANVASWASRIQSGKVSFEQVAKEVSIGPNGAQGGDLGPMNTADLAPVLLERLAGLKPGRVSKPFTLEGVQAQVRLISRGAGQAAPAMSSGEQSLEALSPQIENILREPKLQERYMEYLEQLRKRAVVDIRL